MPKKKKPRRQWGDRGEGDRSHDAAFLFAAVNAIEPNRRYASVLKFLIVFVGVAAVAGKLMP